MVVYFIQQNTPFLLSPPYTRNEHSSRLYQKGLLSFGKARELASLSKWDFHELLSQEGIQRSWAPRKIQILLRMGTRLQWFQALQIRNKAINRGAQLRQGRTRRRPCHHGGSGLRTRLHLLKLAWGHTNFMQVAESAMVQDVRYVHGSGCTLRNR
nr:UPF0175 family protein [Phormidium sp. FACHB-1136]